MTVSVHEPTVDPSTGSTHAAGPTSTPTGPTSTARPPAAHRRVVALDGLRGVAVLCVMTSHFLGARGSGVGVDVFFTLSAFLITSLLVAEHRRTGRISFRGFYRRRAARLLPALLVLALVVGPLVSLVIGTIRQAPLSSLWVLTYLTDFAAAGMLPFSQPYVHTWSLSVEEQFYVLWPLVLLAALRVAARGRARVRLVPFAVGFAVAGLAASVLVFTHLGWLRNYYLPTDHLVALGAGAAVAFAVAGARPGARPGAAQTTGTAQTAGAGRARDARGVLARTVGRLPARPVATRLLGSSAVAVGALAVLVGLTFVPYAGWHVAAAQATTAATAVLAALLVAHLVTRAASPRSGDADGADPTGTDDPRDAVAARWSLAERWLRAPWLVWFGTRSYGLYLYHVPLFLVVKKAGLPGPWALLTAVAVVLSLALAEASYRWLEQPVMRWSRGRAGRRRPPARAAQAVSDGPAPSTPARTH